MSKFSVPWLSLYLIILKFSSCTSIFFETVMTIVTFQFVKMCMTRELLRCFSLILVFVINGLRPENFFRVKLHVCSRFNKPGKKRNKCFRVIMIVALRLQRGVSNYEVAMAIHDSDTGEELC